MEVTIVDTEEAQGRFRAVVSGEGEGECNFTCLHGYGYLPEGKTEGDRLYHMALEYNMHEGNVREVPEGARFERCEKEYIERRWCGTTQRPQEQVDLPSDPHYFVHDNWARPYMVVLRGAEADAAAAAEPVVAEIYREPDNTYCRARDWRADKHGHTELWRMVRARRVFVGMGSPKNAEEVAAAVAAAEAEGAAAAGLMDNEANGAGGGDGESGDAPGVLRCRMVPNEATDPRWADGNSILLELRPNRYLYVGHEIGEFETTSPVEEYYSHVGPNDVPYPVAVTETKAHFMLNEARWLPRAALKRPLWNAYRDYYDSPGDEGGEAKYTRQHPHRA